jgi:hypothetical protein
MKAATGVRDLCIGARVPLPLACGAPTRQSHNPAPTDTALAQLGDAFVSRTANVNGTTVHYVGGGSGPSVILLHGFPQDWSVFRRIIRAVQWRPHKAERAYRLTAENATL